MAITHAPYDRISAHIKCFCLGLLLFVSCSPDGSELEVFEELVPILEESPEGKLRNSPQLPPVAFPYSSIQLPSFMTTSAVLDGFVEMSITEEDNMPESNPITDEGATLGRVLFYDRKLSANGTISCASCHLQEKGFSDPRRQSLGFEGEKTRRHAMSLVNSRYYRRGRFFWDERAASLEEQVVQPFFDEIEMGMTEDTLIARIEGSSYYSELFLQAFGRDEVDLDRIAKALAQFVRSIVSYRSKYDLGREQVSSATEEFPNFNSSENLGKRLFFQARSEGFSCFECHATEAFIGTPLGPQNNGLDPSYTTDPGVFETFSNRPDLRGSFKIPTLRNIALTAPYMHDGRFRSLMDVINHYDQGVQAHPQLSPFMKGADGRPFRLAMSQEEKQALVDFLHTLTDRELSSDQMYSDPFLK